MDIPRYAKLRTPTWLYGGDPRRLLDESRLRSRLVSGEESTWAVQTEENYLRRPANLFTLRAILSSRQDDADRLSLYPVIPGAEASDDVIRRLNELGRRASTSGELPTMVSHAQLLLAAAPGSELPGFARDVTQQLRSIPMEGSADSPFASASMHLIETDRSLVHRLKFASVWLRLQYDERLRGGDTSHILAAHASGGPTFASAASLLDGMLTFDAYVAPLIGCLSPFIWSFQTPRTFGNLITTLGTPIGGGSGEAKELLQTLNTPSANAPTRAPVIPDDAYEAAIEWWTGALNGLFGVLSDFSVFTDADGYYDPVLHLHGLLSVEQLFRRMLSMQATHRDLHARRVLLFTILDTLQRLTGRPLEKHCSHAFAQKTLSRIREKLPGSTGALLLPRATESVAALEEMQEGFFLGAGAVQIAPLDAPPPRSYSPEKAVAQYIKVMRDATHGHGSNRDSVTTRTNALLAQHTGRIPHDLGWLGWLYMLELLSRPDVLRKTLTTRSRANPGPDGDGA